MLEIYIMRRKRGGALDLQTHADSVRQKGQQLGHQAAVQGKSAGHKVVAGLRNAWAGVVGWGKKTRDKVKTTTQSGGRRRRRRRTRRRRRRTRRRRSRRRRSRRRTRRRRVRRRRR